MKVTIKVKDFICIYTSGAGQFKASCLSLTESHQRRSSCARAHTPQVRWDRGGTRNDALSPYLCGLWKSSGRKREKGESAAKIQWLQLGVWLSIKQFEGGWLFFSFFLFSGSICCVHASGKAICFIVVKYT